MSIEETGAPNGAAGEAVLSNAESVARPSIDDTLKAAYREQAGKGAFEEAEGAVPVEAPAQGRVRGPDGKFARANGEVKPNSVSTEPNSATDVAESASAVAQEPVAPKPHDAAPNTWRKDAATDWANLPEKAREEIHRREADFHKGIGQYKEAANFAQTMARELIPYQQTMQQHGKQPHEVVKEATAVWNTLVNGQPQEKATLWLQIAKDYGIDISQSGAAPQQDAAGQTQVDPIVAALQRELDGIKTHLTTQERQRAEAEFSTHVESVNAFGADPKHKHFDAVRDDMAVLIESGRAKDLQEAYDKAIWVNPEVRASLLAEQEQERAKKVAAEAAKARTAAGANVARRGTPPVPSKPGSLEDTLKAGLRAMQSRA